MTQVKEFLNDKGSLDTEINEWLNEKGNSIEIIDIKYSVSSVVFGALVIYKMI